MSHQRLSYTVQLTRLLGAAHALGSETWPTAAGYHFGQTTRSQLADAWAQLAKDRPTDRPATT